MKDIFLCSPAQSVGDPARLARLTRHLRARLLDFDPGGPEVLSADERTGLVAARFPGHDTAAVLDALAQTCRVHARLEGDHALFCLNEQVRFEDLDRLWGCLFDILA